ncbi:hypothetical protein [Haloquadratum walsbyi]|uniref:Uncharacterized protein n=1 Tax=Haloquadratum walsbyi J07HQW2 TaxID=1238425 RepID=U1MXJ0_9EURY|nr:hypothetical protein [Haloquadratum walsbyi]ERG95194.1 MAG: hypothetical protein J07HQW2_01643 [Haloquadratum walsbyi J07HQW2]
MSQQETCLVQGVLNEPHINGRRVLVLSIVERVEEPPAGTGANHG